MISTTPHQVPSQNAGSRLYSSVPLSLYDFWVLWFSNSYAWKCPTKDVLLPLFSETLGERHLDVGVGSGYFPGKTLGSSKCKEVTLADLNPVAIATSEACIAGAVGDSVKVDSLLADAAEPLPLPPSRKFDSISLYYLLHCMPGPPSRKTAVFRTVRPHLADHGVLVGATILGRQAPMNPIAWALMSFYNHLGVFDNWEDTREVFEAGLRSEFDEVDVRVVGRVMVFTARKPRAG
ncbi:S-adenosyl-L-methionine-dependent methyltransferase [Ilyonectria robusta]|uniref:S-adenosyl-L-methionine-dependent methyltransferase n=1 Tax=Ilyonectria robusta TaxID=1079257 RepID=UPI001E8D375E|nr:S-adenosyl-L-methionine-dependent methyltransferase [Ilyonectria robusta]KAH8670513.1 S-adenosyl-L-methionine-dependent methyltransferase [Ilyonectria robusta]